MTDSPSTEQGHVICRQCGCVMRLKHLTMINGQFRWTCGAHEQWENARPSAPPPVTVCEHGKIRRQCETCDLFAEVEALRAELARVRSENQRLLTHNGPAEQWRAEAEINRQAYLKAERQVADLQAALREVCERTAAHGDMADRAVHDRLVELLGGKDQPPGPERTR